MALKGYNSYRGRQGVGRVFLAVLLVLILLAACAFLFLQRFITYSDDGSFALDLPDIPILNRILGKDGGETEPEQNVNLVIDPSESENGEEQKEEEEQAEQPVQHTPQKPETPLRLLGFSELPEDGESLMAELESMGADGFVFTVKTNEGMVRFASSVAMPEAVEKEAVSAEMLSRLCAGEGLYTVARINCFRDPKYAFANMESAGICQSSGYIWYDYDSKHWLEPEKEAARRYVIDLALECAQLGFDELMLEDMCYPLRGRLYRIDYSKNTMDKTDALVQFLTELRAALEPYGVRLSLVLTEAELNGTSTDGETTGFSAEKILPLVDVVYTVTEDAEAVKTAMTALVGDENVPALIPVVADETAVGGWYLPR